MQNEIAMKMTASVSAIDSPAFRARYFDPETNEFKILVPSATCSNCLAKIEGALNQLEFVNSARLNLGSKILTVKMNPIGTLATILNQLSLLGYETKPLAAKGAHQNELKLILRGEKLKMGVAAVCAGNIMMFSLSQYLGASQTVFDLPFGLLSLLLFIPVLTYSALPFYKSFWRSLKIGRLSMDTTVTLALLIGSGFSCYNLWQGRGETYFDSLSALVFLLLAARAWQSHLQRKLQQPTDQSEFLNILSVRVFNENSQNFEEVPAENLSDQQLFLLRAGERLPCDAIVTEDEVEIVQSIWTGEFQTVTFYRDQLVFAGSSLVSKEARFTSSRVGAKSRLGQLLEHLADVRSKKSQFQAFVDRVGERFVWMVLLVALGALLFFWQSNPAEAIHRALALSLLACPCAMAIASPLVFSLALREADQLGIVVKSGDVFEKLGTVRNIIFDKTGSLTLGTPSVVASAKVAPEIQEAIWHLEKDSIHPYGKAIGRHFSDASTSKDPFVKRQTTTRGVRGETEDHVYELCPAEHNSPGTLIQVKQDQKSVLQLELQDPVRSEAFDLIQTLKNNDFGVHLLTGDCESAAQSVAETLKIEKTLVQAQCTPEEKLNYLAKWPNSIMVGDGLNDTLAMAKSQVSIAVQGGMEASLKTADVYFSQVNLLGILKLMNLSQKVRRALKINFGISFIYNVTGGILALTGHIHPLFAALLMPISSTTLVFVSGIQFYKTPPELKKS